MRKKIPGPNGRANSSEAVIGRNAIGSLPVYDAKHFGAAGDGKTMNTTAIQNAIDTANGNGGGTVYFPPGVYLTGTICIKSNVTLNIEAGAMIQGSGKREDYYPWGFSVTGNGSLICARDADNIAIRGRGTIDGSGTSFWKKAKCRWVIRSWRPDSCLRFANCTNLLLEDITVRNTPFFAIHPIDCEGVIVRGVNVRNGVYAEDGVNTDGINPDGCSNVRISNCLIMGGDDCISLKCSNPSGTRTCRDIAITNCVFQTTEVAFRVGPEAYGDAEFRNITFSNCVIRDAGCGIGCMLWGKGIIDGVNISNVSMTLTNGGQPVFMWTRKPYGTIRNVSISNVNAVADGCVFIGGAPEKHLEGMTFDNVRLFMRGGQDSPYHIKPPFPFLQWQHRHCPSNILCRWIDDLKLRNVKVIWNTPEKPEWGSAIRCWSVNDLEIDGFDGRQSLGSDKPAIQLKDVQGAYIKNCKAPVGTGTFLKLDKGTKDVSLMNNDLIRATKMSELAEGVNSEELFEMGNRPSRRDLPDLAKQHPFTEEHAKAQTEELRKIAGATNEVFTVDFSPDGKTVASGGADYAIKLWDVQSSKKRETLYGHTEEIFSVAFSPDGKYLASGSDDYTTKIWDLQTGQKVHTLGNLEYYMWSVAFALDGKTLAVSNYDTNIAVWDVASGKEITRLCTHSNWAFSLAFSPDGKTLASGYWDKTKTTESGDEVTHICLWDTRSWKETQILAGHEKWIWQLAFSSDGRVLASGGEDKTIKLWDTATGKEIRTLAGHADEVTSVGLSRDGKTVASGSKDKTIKFWDVADGKCTATLQEHTGFVWQVSFSPDGKTLASGSADGTVRLWDIQSGKEMAILLEDGN